MEQLAGKVAFITGSSRGIGFSIAKACVEEGMKVVVSGVNEDTLRDAAAQLRDLGGEVLAFALDVRDRDAWARAAREVPDALGPVQLLINNAATYSTHNFSVEEVDTELWDLAIGVNLTGVYNGYVAFVAGMRAAGEGHIVNTSSIGGLMGAPGRGPYCAAKFGVIGLSESIRAELAGSGIGVSILCPGLVETRGALEALGMTPDQVNATEDGGGFNRFVSPDDVARQVIDAVRANDLYIMTHPELRGAVAARFDAVLQSFDATASS